MYCVEVWIFIEESKKNLEKVEKVDRDERMHIGRKQGMMIQARSQGGFNVIKDYCKKKSHNSDISEHINPLLRSRKAKDRKKVQTMGRCEQRERK